MSIFKRAFLYVIRKRGKTILLFAILLVMATFVLTGLSIWKASEAAQLTLRQSLGGKFDVFVDWSNSPYVVKEPVKDEADEETGKTSSSFIILDYQQFFPQRKHLLYQPIVFCKLLHHLVEFIYYFLR